MDETVSDDAAAIAARDFNARIWALVASFPTLKPYCEQADWAKKFLIDDFIDCCHLHSDDVQRNHAVAFVQAVYAGDDQQFNFISAYKVWDGPHRAAFHRWCHSPFWPPQPNIA